MKRFATLLGIAAFCAASLASAQGATTTTKQTTKTTQYTGEVVRYEPGKVIVLRHPDSQVVTYTLGPSAVVPAEIQTGRQVTLVTEPGTSGAILVTRVTTTTVSNVPPGSEAQSNVTSTRETVIQEPSGTRTTTTTTRVTSATGEVVRVEPGRSIILRLPDNRVITYTLAPALTIPADVQTGRKVTLYTEPTDSGSLLVTRVTSLGPEGVSVTRETVSSPEGTQTTTTTRGTTVAGEVVRYEPGQVIVIRQPDTQVVTYTLSPSLQTPVEVAVGRRVIVTTQPSSSGPVVVTQITTETTPEGAVTQTTTEKTMESAALEPRITTVYGTVSAIEPGKTITVVLPNKTAVTYVVDAQSELPTDLAIGKTVTVRTTTVSGSDRPVVRKLSYRTRTQKKKTVS